MSSPASVQVTDYDSLSSPNVTVQKSNDEYSPIMKSQSRETVPYPDNIVLETEKLTQTIQKLLVNAQKANITTFAGHATKVKLELMSNVAFCFEMKGIRCLFIYINQTVSCL